MAEGFAFEIVGDASKANRAIDGVVAGLDKITPKAGQAGRAITSAMSEAQRLTSQQAQTLQQANQRAEQLNATLQREADVLNRIRGPMRENVADMQALATLYRTNQINAHEYAREVDRLRNSIVAQNHAAASRRPTGGGFDVGSALGALPGGSIAAGFVGGGVAGAAQAGVQTAVNLAGQAVQMADAYTSLDNRLRALTGSQQAATELFDKLHASANKTYSDIEPTTDSFLRFNRALQTMGISQQRVLSFTEHLNMQMTLTGTSGAGAQAALMQLSQALASGTLRGEEFNSIIEQAPALLEPIAQRLGVNVGQLRAMANEGKITAQTIFDAYEGQGGAGARIEAAFGQAVPTVGQQFQVLKNEAFALVGQFAKDVELGQAVADVFGRLKEAAELAGAAMKGSAELIGLDAKTLFDLKSITAGALDNFAQFGKSIDFVNSVLGRSTNIQKSAQVAILASAKAANDAAEANLKAAAATDLWANNTSALGQVFKDLGNIGERLWTKMGEDAKKAAAEAKKAADEWAEYVRKATEAEASIRNRTTHKDPSSVTSFDALRPYSSPEYSDAGKQAEDLVNAQAEALIKQNGRVIKAQDDATKKAEENAKRMSEAYATAAGSIAADLISAFEAGDVSADKLLRKAAVLALQLAATSAGGTGGAFLSALAGGLGGGKNGFDYKVGSSGLQLPGFQSGGSITRQAGGPEPLLAMWWMQPNETLSIRTEEQQRRAQQGAGSGGGVTLQPQFTIYQERDRREIVDDSRDGLRAFVRIKQRVERNRR